MSDVVKIDDFRKESKRRELKEKARLKLQIGKEWFDRNKEALVTLVPIIVGGVATIVKVVGKRCNLNKEETLKDEYCYDRSLGHYWRLKRPLSNNEWLEIDRRKKEGERLSDILDDMRVLK